MENVETGKISHVSLSVADKMASLLYSYKYGMKKRYFEVLDSLKPVMDSRLFMFFFRFGCASTSWRDNDYVPKEDDYYGK